MTTVVFDFDGTLVDSRSVVVEAYRRAGVVMPEHAWGSPGTSWIKPDVYKEVYRKKQEWYAQLIHDAPELPPAEVARELADPALLTSADFWVARKRVNMLHVNFSWVWYGQRDKMRRLADRDTHEWAIYIDDLPVGPLPPFWQFILYEGQSALELWHQIGELIL